MRIGVSVKRAKLPPNHLLEGNELILSFIRDVWCFFSFNDLFLENLMDISDKVEIGSFPKDLFIFLIFK